MTSCQGIPGFRNTPKTWMGHNMHVNSHRCTHALPLRSRGHVTGWQLRQRRVLAFVQAKADSMRPRKEEQSNIITQELLFFLFQQECDAQLMRALNLENYDAAQDVRERRQQVDEALAMLERMKRGGNETEGASAPDDAMEGVRLRSELQRAIEEERYDAAAALRDQLQAVAQRTQAANARASAAETERAQRVFRLGQRVVHARDAYTCVVYGWDDQCAESADWQDAAGIAELEHGAAQPFYHVLVDVRTAGSTAEPPVAYVPQELLNELQPSDAAPSTGTSGSSEFQNPYSFLLFLGPDERGDFIPSRQLRNKYGQPRRDVAPPETEPEPEPNDDPQPGPD